MSYKAKDAVYCIVKAFNLNQENESSEDNQQPNTNSGANSSKKSYYKSVNKSDRVYNMRTSDHHTVLKTWVIKHKDDLTILKEAYNFAITFLDDFSQSEPTSGKITISENTIKYVYNDILKNCKEHTSDVFLPEISGLFKVITFIYNSKELNHRDLNKIIKNINNVINGEANEYVDPLSNHTRKFAHIYEMSPNQKIKAIKTECSKTDNSEKQEQNISENYNIETNKKYLYENIMKDIAKIIKKKLYESQ